MKDLVNFKSGEGPVQDPVQQAGNTMNNAAMVALPGMQELFIIVERSTSGKVKLYHTKELAKAICMQYSILTGMKIEEVAATISDDEIVTVMNNLQNELMDMAHNETTEAYILFFPPSN